MKTKTVTIHNWDGSKYDIEVPAITRYVGIYSDSGDIACYRRKPRLDSGGYGRNEDIIGYSPQECPYKNLPFHDGYNRDGNPPELILKIEEV